MTFAPIDTQQYQLINMQPAPQTPFGLFEGSKAQKVLGGLHHIGRQMYLADLAVTDPDAYAQQLQIEAAGQEQQMLGNLRAEELAGRKQERAQKMRVLQQEQQRQEMMQKALGGLAPQLAQRTGLPKEQLGALINSGADLGTLGKLSELMAPPEFDLASAAETALVKQGMGVPLTPQDTAAINAYTQKSQLTRPNTTVNVNTGAELQNIAAEESQKIYGKGIGTRVDARQAAADEALNQNLQLDIMAEALSRGVETGMGKSQIVSLQNLYTTLTGAEPPEDLAPTELVKGIGGQLALRFRNPDSGLGLPGATSNRELQFLQSIAPSLELTTEGNRELIKAFKRVNKMKQGLAEFQQKVIADNNGVIPMNIDLLARDFVSNYEIFKPEERARLESFIQGSGPQTQGSGGIPPDIKSILEKY